MIKECTCFWRVLTGRFEIEVTVENATVQHSVNGELTHRIVFLMNNLQTERCTGMFEKEDRYTPLHKV